MSLCVWARALAQDVRFLEHTMGSEDLANVPFFFSLMASISFSPSLSLPLTTIARIDRPRRKTIYTRGSGTVPSSPSVRSFFSL